VDQFNENYSSWVSSIKSGGKEVVCGIDRFNESENMLPLWEIVKKIDADKGAAVKAEFDKRLAACNTTLNNIKLYTPVMVDMTVIGQKGGSMKAIPAPNNHAVLKGYTNMDNSKEFFEGSSNIPNLLDANDGAGSKTQYVHIFYKTEQMISGYDGKAIADIILLNGGSNGKNQPPKTPSGYTLFRYDLNAGCGSGGDSDYLYLAYKKATASDIYVIDFIGGNVLSARNYPNPPAAANGNEKWEWVKIGTTSTVADLAVHSGNKNYIRLMMHKVKREDKK
jgi:hypothetical protein